jgi:hypothetical protein
MGVSYTNSTLASPQLLAHIHISGGSNCGDAASVTISATDVFLPSQASQPRLITILLASNSGSIDGAQVRISRTEVSMTPSSRSGPTRSVVSIGRLRWNDFDPIVVRFYAAGLTTSAGFRSCNMRSPELFAPAASTIGWTAASAEANRWRRAHDLAPAPVSPIGAGIIDLAVQGKAPDVAATDTQATVIGRSIRLTCTSQLPPSNPDDPSFIPRIVATKSNCGSVERFATEGSANVLNIMVFFAGILLSTGVAILVDTLLGGRRKHRAPATP